MSAEQVDAYLAEVPEPQRATLQRLRHDILAVVPEAEQCLSYGMPAFRVRGKVVAGFAAFKNHCAYLPHSGSVLAALGEEVGGYEKTSGSLHVPIGQQLPASLVRRLVEVKLVQLGL